MWRHFETGMIEEYLGAPERAARYPIVELEALPGQPTAIPPEADSYAVAGSLASRGGTFPR